jgi:YHS domain-containing protein
MADMRNHVELADKAMADMEKHMSLCMGLMEKMHGGMPPGEKAARAVDPVCNMAVDTAGAPSAMYEGKAYYFCSEQDKAKFEKNPAQYLKKV